LLFVASIDGYVSAAAFSPRELGERLPREQLPLNLQRPHGITFVAKAKPGPKAAARKADASGGAAGAVGAGVIALDGEEEAAPAVVTPPKGATTNLAEAEAEAEADPESGAIEAPGTTADPSAAEIKAQPAQSEASAGNKRRIAPLLLVSVSAPAVATGPSADLISCEDAASVEQGDAKRTRLE
jgi:hypothetical protein